MSKVKYTKYQKEILEMYYKGKSAAEIAEIINAKYSNSDVTESSVNGAIKMNKGKQNENEQTKMFSENQKRVQNKENSMQKKGTDKQENSEVQKMKESAKALLQAQTKSFSELTKELHNTFVIFTIINSEFSRAVDALELRNRKNQVKYLLLSGLFLMTMTFAMFWGYRDAHPGEDISFVYIPLLRNILIGFFIGLGIPLIIKIGQIIRRKRS